MGRRIVSIIVCIIFIIGGLSGEFVLRGTNSSKALVVIASIYLVYEVIKIIGMKKENSSVGTHMPYEEERQNRLQTFLQQPSQTIIPCAVTIKNASGRPLLINNTPVGDMNNTIRSFTTDRQYNILQSGNAGAEYDFIFEAISAGEIVINMLPDNVTGPHFEIEHT